MEHYGSFVMTGHDGRRLDYQGLSKDVGKLPTQKNNSDLATGSTAYCIDSGELYIYESLTGQWYKQ